MSMFSSGDVTADSRFSWACHYRDAGDNGAAIELMRQALDIASGWAGGWFVLADIAERAGDAATACDAFLRALALDPADAAGARPRLIRLGLAPADDAFSPDHIAALYDNYAPRFEASLVTALDYRGPDLIRMALAARCPTRRFEEAIDLGCGTGLTGAELADLCASIDGVDLSAGMLRHARAKGIYRSLVQADVRACLAAQPESRVDLVTAADLLIYLGDLCTLFGQIARVLRAGGLFAFTVQRHDGEGAYHLGEDLRYAHSESGLRRWLGDAGFEAPAFSEATLRTDRGSPVAALVCVAERIACL